MNHTFIKRESTMPKPAGSVHRSPITPTEQFCPIAPEVTDAVYGRPGDRIQMGRRRKNKKQKGFGHKPLKCPYCWKTSTMAFNWKPHAKRIHKIDDDIVAKVYEDMRDAKCPPSLDQLEVEMGVELPRFPMERPHRHTAYIQYQLATQKGPNGEPSIADQANLDNYRRHHDLPRAINFELDSETRKRGRPTMERAHALPTRRSQRQRTSKSQDDTYVWDHPELAAMDRTDTPCGDTFVAVKEEPMEEIHRPVFTSMPGLQTEDNVPVVRSEEAPRTSEDLFLKLPEPQVVDPQSQIDDSVKAQMMHVDSTLANEEDMAMAKIRELELALHNERSKLKMIRDRRLVSLMTLMGKNVRSG